MNNQKIAILGCGNLGTSIVEGLLEAGTSNPASITITKRNIEPIAHYLEKGVNVTSNNREAVTASTMIVLALKPHNILEILNSVKPELKEGSHTIVSLATGISTQDIERVIGTDIPIVLAMPNTAADVKESITCLSAKDTSSENFNAVKHLFEQIGDTVVINEALMQSATVIGACGIAYVLRFIRAMIQGGIEIGFDAQTASKIVNQTVKGASQLLIENKQHPEYEIDKVTTPRGCTIAGLNEMEHNGFSSALIKGITTSYNKIEGK